MPGYRRCERCGKLTAFRCVCKLFYVKIPEWFGDDELKIYRDDHETAAAEYVETADCGDYILATPGKTVEVLVRGCDETDWKKFVVEAEHILEYHAKEQK